MANEHAKRGPRVVAILAARKDEAGDAAIYFRTEDGKAIELRMDPGIVGSVGAGLLSILGQIGTKESDGGISGQPITIRGFTPGVLPNRQPMLDLLIENSGHLLVTFPRSAIASFQGALTELLELSKPTSQGH